MPHKHIQINLELSYADTRLYMSAVILTTADAYSNKVHKTLNTAKCNLSQ